MQKFSINSSKYANKCDNVEAKWTICTCHTSNCLGDSFRFRLSRLFNNFRPFCPFISIKKFNEMHIIIIGSPMTEPLMNILVKQKTFCGRAKAENQSVWMNEKKKQKAHILINSINKNPAISLPVMHSLIKNGCEPMGEPKKHAHIHTHTQKSFVNYRVCLGKMLLKPKFVCHELMACSNMSSVNYFWILVLANFLSFSTADKKVYVFVHFFILIWHFSFFHNFISVHYIHLHNRMHNRIRNGLFHSRIAPAIPCNKYFDNCTWKSTILLNNK